MICEDNTLILLLILLLALLGEAEALRRTRKKLREIRALIEEMKKD